MPGGFPKLHIEIDAIVVSQPLPDRRKGRIVVGYQQRIEQYPHNALAADTEAEEFIIVAQVVLDQLRFAIV